MQYKALVTFAGLVSMVKGEVRTITDTPIAEDLLKAKLIEPLEEKKPAQRKRAKKETTADK